MGLIMNEETLTERNTRLVNEYAAAIEARCAELDELSKYPHTTIRALRITLRMQTWIFALSMWACLWFFIGVHSV